MKENTASPEKKAEQKSSKLVLQKVFEKFRKRSDDPKYPYKEQHKLAGKPETSQEFIESKEDKKHISPIWGVLLTTEMFLKSEEAKHISEIEKRELLNKKNDLLEDLKRARQKENISDELLAKVSGFMDEVESYLK
ncbi:MAG: hypothetical protein Q7S73_02085 [bacterium]|nr:hypothetical protein [bacterium]